MAVGKGKQILTSRPHVENRDSPILINQSTNQPPLWGQIRTYLSKSSGHAFCDARHQGPRASSVSLPSSHCKLCVLVLRMQMHFKANRVTEKRGEAAEGGKRRVSLTKRDEDAGLV